MASQLLYAPGTNGFISAPINLATTELNALGSGAAATSSVGGTSGVYTQSNFGNAPWLEVFFISGGVFTPVAGQCIYGWFLKSRDGGTNYETRVATPSATVLALPRPADFIIPLDNAAFASGNIKWAAAPVRACWPTHKFVIQNIGGATPVALPATGNIIMAGGVTMAQ